MPVPLIPILVAIVTTVGAVLWEGTKFSADQLYKFSSLIATHPLLAYFLILFLLFVDTATFGQTGFGLVGNILQGVIGTLFRLEIPITSFQLLVILTIFPVVIFVLGKSRQLQKR
jgi:hypothetical protein